MNDNTSQPSEIALRGASGISEEDQKDILDQIENVASENRLQAGPELFAVHARQNGLFVPLAVNVGAFLVLILGVLGLYFLFRQGQAGWVQNQIALQSPEGRLIAEIRKESEAQLTAKNQQIASIQAQMTELGRERDGLQKDMDAKVAAKEAELRREMQTALEAERTRLASSGYSQAVIEQKLREFEKQKNLEFEAQLTAFRQKAEADRAAVENRLVQQQKEFQRNLDESNSQRDQILSNFKKRESILQERLDQQARDLQNTQASQVELARAQEELRRLNDQQSESDSVENQIIGLFTKISQTIQSRQYSEAIQDVQNLISFLNQNSVRNLPSLKNRLPSDLLLANTLNTLLNQDKIRVEADAARVDTTQGILASIRTFAQEGDYALSQGRVDEAEGDYKRALSQIPEVRTSYQYFLNKQLRADQVKQLAITDALAKGDALLAQGDYTQALASYDIAFTALPLAAIQRDAFKENYAQAALSANRESLDTQFAHDLDAAQVLLAAGKDEEALGAYAALLERYPMGTTGSRVVPGIRQASADLQKTAAGAAAANADLVANLKTAQAAAVLAGSGELQRAQVEVGRMTPLADRLTTLEKNYTVFSEKYDGVDKTSSAGVLQSKSLLDDFLSSPEAKQTFPGLDDRFHSNNQATEQAARDEAFIVVNEIIANLATLATSAEKKAYVQTLQQRYLGDAKMSQFLQELLEVV